MAAKVVRTKINRRLQGSLQLVATKLSPPNMGHATLPRNHHASCFIDDPSARLIMLQAPAGFGKTTLMTQYWSRLRSQRVPCGWLTLDQSDNDMRCFMAYLIGMLGKSLLIPEGQARLLLGGDGKVPNSTGSLVVNVLDRLSRNIDPCVIFLDDMEIVANPEVSDFVTRLIELSHPNVRFVIASRSIPKIGLGRLRLQGGLREIGPEILRFKEAETTSFVVSRLGGARLDERDIHELHHRTEGWPAALQLACLSLEERADAKGFVHSFSGRNGDLAEYLAEDVLERQPENVRDVLLATSLFRRFNGPLCEAVTGQDDAIGVLSQLETAGMFLRRIETGDSGSWLEYHSLFSEFLRGQLLLRHPNRIPVIYQKASQWYESQGFIVDAADYARRAGDLTRSVSLFESIAMSLIHQGMLNTVIAYAEGLPHNQLENHSRLYLAYIWALAFERRFDTAWGALRRFASSPAFCKALDPEIRDNYLTLESMIPACSDDFGTVERRAFSALKQMSRTDTFEHGALANVAAHCRMARGEFSLARETLAAAQASHSAAGSLFGQIFSQMLHGLADLSELHLRNATDRLRGAFEQAHEAVGTSSRSGAVVAGFLADALYETNDIAGARLALQDYLPLIAESGIPDAVITSYCTLARIQWLENDDAGALATLADGKTVGFRRALPRVVNTLRWEIGRFKFLQGERVEAERCIREIDEDDPLGSHEPGLMTPPETLVRDIASLRMALWQGRAARAAGKLPQLIRDARRRRFPRRLLKLQLLYALALGNENDHSGAVSAVAEALLMGTNQGFVRIYLDEGPLVMNLVRAARSRLLAISPPERAEAVGRRWEELVTMAAHDRVASSIAFESGLTCGANIREESLTEAATMREVEILEFLSHGLSNREIARRMVISETTVKWHLRNIFGKLHASNRTEAVFSARRRHLIA